MSRYRYTCMNTIIGLLDDIDSEANEDIERLQGEVDNLNYENGELRDEITGLENRLAEMENEIERLEVELNERPD